MSELRRLLAIEDARADFLLLERELKKHWPHLKCQRVDTRQGLEAALDGGDWDFILSDFNLPDLNFETVIALIQAHQPEVPLILVTGAIGEEQAVELMRTGVQDFVSKSHLARLEPAMRRALDEARERAGRKKAEQALHQSEAMLRLFIEHAPAALAMFDLDMRYLAVSRRWLEDYRLEGRRIIGQSHYRISPEISAEWREVHRRGLAGEVLQGDDNRFERTDGSVRRLHWEVRPWFADDNRVGGIVVFTEDVTERKATEARLQRLTQVVGHIATARTLSDLTAIACGTARELTGADGATLAMRDGQYSLYLDEDAVRPLWKKQRFPLSTCISGWAMRHAKLVVIEDVYADRRISPSVYRPTFVQSLAIVPIGSDPAVGAIGCYWARRHRASEEELRLQQALADAMAVGLANLALVERLDAARQAAEQAAAEARAGEASYRSLVAALSEGIVVLSSDGTVQQCNPAAERLFALTPEAAARRWVREDGAPIPHQELPLPRALATGVAQRDIVVGCPQPDGEFSWLSVNAEPVRDPQTGALTSAVASFTDITARRQAQQELLRHREALETLVMERTRELAAAHQQFRDFVLRAPIAMCVVDLAGGIKLRNEQFLNLFGYDEAEVPDIDAWWPRAYPDTADRAQAQATWAAAVQAAKAERRTVTPIEQRIRCRDGSLRDIEIAGVILGSGLLATFVDVTERRRAEAMIREREHFLRTVTDALPGMVGYWSADLRCRFANIAFQTWFDRPPGQILDVPMRELIGPELFAQHEPNARAALAGNYQRFERSLLKADGEQSHLLVQYIPDEADGKVVGFFSLVLDVTELKNIQLDLESSNRDLQLRTHEAETIRRQLEQQRSLLQGVVDNLPFGLVVYDGQRQLMMRNRQFGTLLNYSPELLAQPGLGFDDLVRCNAARGDYPGQALDEVLARLVASIQSRRHLYEEHRQFDGNYLSVQGTPLPGGARRAWRASRAGRAGGARPPATWPGRSGARRRRHPRPPPAPARRGRRAAPPRRGRGRWRVPAPEPCAPAWPTRTASLERRPRSRRGAAARQSG
jgi:PAS domain S-box-containing protein